MIEFIPELVSYYPASKYIYMMRNGVSNVDSRMRKFPNESFEQHCRQWRNNIVMWNDYKTKLPADSYLELKIEELSNISVLESLYKFVTNVKTNLGRDFDEFTRFRIPSIEKSAYTNSIAWDAQMINTFNSICGDIMAELQYEFPENMLNNTVILPPPYTDFNIVKKYNSDANIFPHVSNGDVWIYLHPSSDKDIMTEITYKDVTLQNATNFKSTIKVDNNNSNIVVFKMSIYQDGKVIEHIEKECGGGEGIAWDADLTTLHGLYDISISTRMKNNSTNNYAHAMILNPTFN